MRKFVYLLILVFPMIIFSACINDDQKLETTDMCQAENDETAGSVFPGGRFATYEKFDRQLSLNDFYDLERGMTYQDIVEHFGETNGQVGSYSMFPYYELSDGTYLLLDLNINDELNGLILVDQRGREYLWLPFDNEK